MAAPTIPLVAEQEYLASSYEPDREFVDGLLVERNVGAPDHGLLQLIVAEHLRRFRKEFGFQVIVECRTRVRQSRYRIPDVTVVHNTYDRKARFLSEVPLAIIEILSPDDRMKTMLERLREFEQLGVRNIVVLDPEDRLAFRYQGGALTETKFDTLHLPAGEVSFSTDELFAQLDE